MSASTQTVADGGHSAPVGLSPTGFKNAFRHHAAGVAVISAETAGGPVALTATSVISVSAEPALLVFSLSALSSATPRIKAAQSVVVHLLTEDDLDLARLCSTPGADRFEDANMWSRLATGEPHFHGVRNWVRGEIVDTMTAGGSTIVAVLALESSLGEEPPVDHAAPLVYHDRAWHALTLRSRID